VEGVVEVVGPLGVEAVAADLAGTDQPGVVQVALGDEHEVTAKLGLERVYLLGQLLEDMHRRGVDDGVDGVDPEAVEVVVPQPHERVVAEEASDLVATGPVDVDRITPRRPVPVREVRAEVSEVVADGPEVVVHDVQDHRESPGVAGIHQALEALRPAIGVVGGPEIDAIVAPPARPRELRDRHELDVRDAETPEMAEPLDDSIEGAGGREGADVELVDHSGRQRRRLPARVRPVKGRVVDAPRRAVDALRLPRRSRVRQRRAPVEYEGVVGARSCVRHLCRPPPAPAGRHGMARPPERQLHAVSQRRPDAEPGHGVDRTDVACACAFCNIVFPPSLLVRSCPGCCTPGRRGSSMATLVSDRQGPRRS
jgi:hypothetical protein